MDSEASYRHQNRCRQGEQLKFAVDPCCLDLCDCQAECHNILLLESLAFKVDLLIWMNLRGLQVIAPLVHGSLIIVYAIKDAALVQQLSSWFRLISIEKQQAYATIGLWLKYIKMIVGFKTLSAHYVTLLSSVAESLTLLCDPHIWSDVQCEDVSFFLHKRHGVQELFIPCSSDDCTAAAVGTLMNGVNTVYKFLLGGYVLNLIAEKRIMQVSIQSDRTKISGLELLLKQSLSQAFLHLFNEDYGFLRCIYVIISARFGFLTEIPYGSLPRPPDELLVISFSLLYFTLCSSCPRCNGLHLEGEY
ncbi:hypothetical protein Rs2_46380 [Raphanus sativus]|nr:hypothetical protein Rs2_46380 [Raphanus sativus]